MPFIRIAVLLGDISNMVAVTTTSNIFISIAVILLTLLLVIGAGALLAFLVSAVNSFLIHNVPSTAGAASFSDGYAMQSGDKQNQMAKETNISNSIDAEDDELTGNSHAFGMLVMGSRYVALLTAWIATCGSLFFSEALGWVPCLLCWYQRILMYPLSLILAVGILRKDKGLYKYVLVLSIPGACMSLVHYLDQKTTLFRGMINCVVGVPCSADYLNWFGGVVTIPFLALIAFLIITFCMVVTRLDDTDEEEAGTVQLKKSPSSRLAERALVFIIIAVVVAAFLIAGISVRDRIAVAAAPVPEVDAKVAPLPAVDSAALAKGKALYDQSCAICHGMNGEGTPAGRALTNSVLIQTSTTVDLVKFVRLGRGTSDPHNTTGLNMPASGGQPDYSDTDIAAVIAYIRQLAGVNPLGK